MAKRMDTTMMNQPKKGWRIYEFFQENNGMFSSSRLFSFLIVAAALVDWMHAVFATPAAKWDPTVQTISLVIGVLGFKVTQKFAEKKPKEDQQTTETPTTDETTPTENTK